MNKTIHLWDIDHPYYCNEGNYFARDADCHSHYKSWPEFVAEQGDADLDMNLVFRFDWEPPRNYEDPDEPIAWQGDEYYRDSVLKLFYMGQRKGLFRWVTIEVCRADEQAVREWLQVRWDHMKKLWEPLSQPVEESSTGGEKQ